MTESATLPVYVVEGDVCCGVCCRPLSIGQHRTSLDMGLAIGSHACPGPAGRAGGSTDNGQSGMLPWYGSNTALVEVRLSAADQWELFCLAEKCEWTATYPWSRRRQMAAPLGDHLLTVHTRLIRFDKKTGRLYAVDGGVL